MKLLKEWVLELPREFREEMHISSSNMEGAETIGQALSIFLQMASTESIFKWDALARRYARKELKSFHISYWIEKDRSTGLTVDAFDMFHAIDIVLARTEIEMDQIIYAHSKDSQYNGKEIR